MLENIILKTERYVVKIDTNWETFGVSLGLFFLIFLAVSCFISANELTGRWKVGFPILATSISIFIMGLAIFVACSTESDGHCTYATEYYILLKDYKIEMSDNYYIHRQDGNILILRENGK